MRGILFIGCILIIVLLLAGRTVSSGFSKDGSLPHLEMAQAAVDMGGGDGKPNISKRTPSSFSLRVGRACVLVSVLDKDPLVISTGGALSILRTPELLCSLVGRLSDCLTVRSMVIEMDENSISECGSHISAAGLALQLADDTQLRSLYTNTRPLVYNSLILGRDIDIYILIFLYM